MKMPSDFRHTQVQFCSKGGNLTFCTFQGLLGAVDKLLELDLETPELDVVRKLFDGVICQLERLVVLFAGRQQQDHQVEGGQVVGVQGQRRPHVVGSLLDLPGLRVVVSLQEAQCHSLKFAGLLIQTLFKWAGENILRKFEFR